MFAKYDLRDIYLYINMYLLHNAHKQYNHNAGKVQPNLLELLNYCFTKLVRRP